MKTKLTALVAGIALSAASSTVIADDGLSIWVNGDKCYTGIAKVGAQFEADTGIPVKVEHPDKPVEKFQQAAGAGGGPDMLFWAHDRLGELSRAGLISSIEPGAAIKEAYDQLGWDAVTVDGKYYGYPISIEAVGLIYNKDLVSTPPKTWEEIPALHKKLQAEKGVGAILWDYDNTYFTWPMLAANGGYIFKNGAKGYDTSDVGVNNAGAVKGAELLKSLIDGGVMPKGANYNIMESSMNSGKVAMMINGPWSWANLNESGTNFGVAPLPTLGGKSPKPMVGVLAATLNSNSAMQEEAKLFLEEYLLQVDGLKTCNADVALGAVANKAYMAELASDPNVAATFKNAKLGEPMPNIPEMGKFWGAMGPALKNITGQGMSPKEALDNAAQRMAR